jgi:PAS domain S-box-containing protein
MQGFARDITARYEAEARALRLHRVNSLLSTINQLIVRTDNPQTILEQTCRIAVEEGGFLLAWVGWLEGDGKRVRVAASAGTERRYLETLSIDLSNPEHASGPTATALRTGEPCVVDDIAHDPRMAPWRQQALASGFRSSAAFPLRRNDRVGGVLNFYASEPHFFDKAEQKLLKELAADIAYALAAIDQEQERQRAERELRESRERFARAFESSPDSVTITTLEEGRYLEVNPAFTTLSGYTREEAIGRTVAELGLWVSLAERNRLVERIRAERSFQNFEAQFRRKDGMIITVLLSGGVMEYGGRPCLVAIGRDITERKRNEAAMRFMQFAIDRASEGVCWVRPDGRYTYVNDAVCRLLEYSREELLRMRVFDVHRTLSPEVFRGRWNEVRKSGAVTVEVELCTRSGRLVPVELTINHLEFEGQEFHCTFMRDLEPRRKAEEQLRLQAAALETAANAIVITDRDGKIQWANPAFAHLTGYELSEALNRNPRILKSGQHPREFYEEMWKTILGGNVWRGEIINRRKDGTLYTEEMSITPVRDGRGEISHFVAVKQDITQRKAAEEALRESEERHREFVRNAVHGMYRSTPDGRLLEVNPALVAMLGYENESELLGRNLEQEIYRYPEERRRILETIEKRKRASGIESEWRRKDGTYITVRQSGRLVTDEEGRPQYFETIVEDVTERRLLEQQLRASQKFEAIGKLAGGIAHDFNNVIGAILGWAELSEDLVPPDSKLLRNLKVIEDQARKAAGLTRQLLAFARRQHLEPREMNLNQTVTEVVNLLEKVIGKDIELRTTLAPDLAMVRADATQVEQVLMNLCVNARDAMPHGGVLMLKTENIEYSEEYCLSHPYMQPGKFVRVQVSDTGCGMGPEVLEHIFEPFFTTKEKGRGTGLGLATVYGIVKQHGGFIHVYSEPGKGTTFNVNFPAHEGPAAPAMKREVEGEAVRGGTETVLVGEDHAEMAEMARNTLERLGYTVLLASNGEEAVELFEKNKDRIQAVFLDVVMPLLNGPEAYKRMCAIRPGVPVLFASGYSADVPALGELVERGYPILQKPYSMREMARKIRSVLDQSKREQA